MKKAVKALAVLLALCFCMSALVLAVGAAAADAVTDGTTFRFGTYPQSRVQDKALIDSLNKLSESNKKDTVTLGGKTYASYRIVKNGTPGGPYGTVYGYEPYDKDHGYPTYWFVYEPIEWRVLGSDSTGVLLLSEYVLCSRAFNDKIRSDNTWENSDVRKWLNDSFLKTAFTAKEQAFVKNSALTNEPNPVHGAYNGVASAFAGDPNKYGAAYEGTYSGGPTTDKVFLPSFNEITNADYGFNVGWKDKVGEFGQPVGYYETDILPGEHCGRSTGATDYAKCQGVWANLQADPDGNYTIPVPTVRYWLRTAGYNADYAAAVLEDGRVTTGFEVNYDIVGVRPMMRVDPSAVPDDIIPTDDPSNPDKPDDLPFNIEASDDEFHYKQKNLSLKADVPVTWTSSDPRIAEIDPDTGEVTIHRVGNVTITATSVETGETVEFEMEIEYLWWQQLIRIFLFGWVWY
jgi:hypothetical protein